MFEASEGRRKPAFAVCSIILVVRLSALVGAFVLAGVVSGSNSDAGVAKSSVPPAFQPVSFTAVSEQDFWLLGTMPCPQGRCSAILRTEDGGRSFVRVHAPVLPTSGTTPELRFANRLDGFAFVRWRGLFYATHDGGTSWKRLALGRILAFATGAGNSYVVTTRRFERSPVSADAWRATPLPFPSDGSPLELEAHGASLWLLGTRRSNGRTVGELARSRDAGRTFAALTSPCVAGLGGELAPVSASVVWAVCPTGMLAGALRSTNGGIGFVRLRTPALANSAQIVPASESTAVLDRGGVGRLLRTTDGGNTWRAPKTPGQVLDVLWAGFTDSRVGAALVQTRYDVSTKTQATALWRTADGGATWSTVRVRST